MTESGEEERFLAGSVVCEGIGVSMVRRQDWLCFVGNEIQCGLALQKLLAVLTFRLRKYLSSGGGGAHL